MRRGTNLFHRGSDRIGGTSAAELNEQGPRESTTEIFRECPLRTFVNVRLRGTILWRTTVPRNYSAADNCVTELFRRGLIPPPTHSAKAPSWDIIWGRYDLNVF